MRVKKEIIMEQEKENLEKQEKKNPFLALAEFYKESVEKGDKKGFAETYKQATKLLFKRLKKDTGLELHFTDVKYLNGYFIFGFGSNSVVHFHIKEAPGWLGGIWWSPLEIKDSTKENPKYRTDALGCSLFFQYEEEIDKFKPSASMFVGEFDFHFEEGFLTSGYMNAYGDLGFIIKEPYLAYYKEMHYTDFNHEYVSREKAKRFFIHEHELREKQKAVKKQNEEVMLETLKYIVGPIVKSGDAFIVRSECFSPKYEVFFRNIILDDGKPLFNEEGHYYLFSLGYEDEEKDKKLWKDKEKECENRSKKVHDIFWNECSTCVEVRNSDNFERILKDCIKDKTIVFYQGNYKEKTE